MMNNVFRSPDFTPGRCAIALYSGNASRSPVATIRNDDPVTMVARRAAGPDLRYAVLLVLIGVFCLSAGCCKRRTTSPDQRAAYADDVSTRVLAAIGCGLAVDLVAWLSEFR